MKTKLILWFSIANICASCATQPDGTKTFLSLDKQGWGELGLDVGKATISLGISAYLNKRSEAGIQYGEVTAAK